MPVGLRLLRRSSLLYSLLLGDFDPQNTGFQLVHEAEWVMGLTYKLGAMISILFVMLTIL